jgi:octaprenyl-diphosphate synthase
VLSWTEPLGSKADTSKSVFDARRAVLDDVYGGILRHLDGVEAILQEEWTAPEEFARDLLEHSRRFGGKRIRPAMMLLAAELAGRVQPHHVSLGAVVEMLHHATLIHDDVLDDSRVRRRVPTLNARWGNEAPVLLGDYVFARAFALCARLDLREANLLLSSTAAQMCLGELTQIAARGRFDLSEADYLEIIRKKTASLFGASCRLGALGNEVGEELAEALCVFGANFGMAFQIVDDYLDLMGSHEELGKSTTDLLKREWTLPLIALLKRLPEGARRDLCARLANLEGTEAERERVRTLVRQHEADAYTLQCAAGYAALARRALEPLKALGPTESLSALTEFVVARRS